MKSRVCILLCLFTLLGFVLMFVQAQWRPFTLKPLNGYTPDVEQPVFTLEQFASGDYQEKLERYVSEHLGFRELFIRSYNQAVYSCFKKITNDHIVEGEDHELFLQMYLNDITGATLKQNYPTVEQAKADARKNVQETLRLIDTLQQFNIDFLFVFAPSKTAVYPEKMPSYYQKQISDFSLEEYYIELFKENHIPHIDFLSYFKAIKDTVAYPLYTRTGTHWAESTIPWVSDSILRKIETLTGFDLAEINDVDENLTKHYSEIDAELEASMNLLFPYPKPALPRPVVALSDTVTKDRPNLLVIGDSYANQLVSSAFAQAFNHWDWWAYNRDIHSSRPRFNWRIVNEEFDAVTVLQEADIVLAVFTQPMMYNYMFEFPRTAQELLEKGYFNEDEAMETVIQMIKDEPKWYEGVVNYAEEHHITLEESLTKNARYWLDCLKRKIKRPSHEE